MAEVMTTTNPMLEMFRREGVLQEKDVAKVIEILKNNTNRRSVRDILIEDLSYDRHKVFQAFCKIYAFREIDLSRVTISDGWVEFINNFLSEFGSESRDEFIENKIIPFGFSEKSKDIIIFLTPDPADRKIEKIINDAGIKQYELAYTRLEDLDNLVSRVVAKENEFLKLLNETSDELSFEEEEQEEEIDEDELASAVNQSVLVNLFEASLIEAVHQGASDIHIFPKENNVTEIYFRVDGRLKLWHKKDNIKPEAFLAVAKDRTKNVDRFEWESAQDGFIQRYIDHYLIRFRVSILPIVTSQYSRKYESVVIRVLDDRKVIKDLDALGFDEIAKREFLKAIKKPQGMVILTGPTGSGKSTTLVAALNHVMNSEVNVLTVEDPVEYNIRGARQLKISHKMNFDQAIRSILRHDPDIVMVGEIRDAKTAEIAIKLANTGHLTFSTLHTNDSASVVSRLYKMGIEPFLIAYAINLVVAQRLIRKLCPHCRQPIDDIEKENALRLGVKAEELEQTTIYKPVGCDKCNKGYKGRMGIYEALPFTPEIRKIILNASNELDEDAVREASAKHGMLTLRHSAIRQVLLGKTSLEEVAAVTSE
ncbi:MAG: type II/IV secretion system protein [Calditrichaeota bacterium]|nr:type II/IV secretion system protein [Calditrichota bacterium]